MLLQRPALVGRRRWTVLPQGYIGKILQWHQLKGKQAANQGLGRLAQIAMYAAQVVTRQKNARPIRPFAQLIIFPQPAALRDNRQALKIGMIFPLLFAEFF